MAGMVGAGKGVVLEVTGRRATVLTAGGEFVRVPVAARGWRAGDEVSLPLPAPSTAREHPAATWAGAARRPRLAWAAAAAAVAVLVAFAVVGRPPVAPAPVALAYLSVDINPSVELGVDSDGTVAWARGLNEEGKALVRGAGLRGDAVPDAVAEVVDRACARGYLGGAGPHAVVLAGALSASAPAGGGGPDIAALVGAAGEAVGKALRARGAAGTTTAAIAASPGLREEAERLGLSVGKYAVLLTAQKAGLVLDPARLGAIGIGRAIQEAGGRPEDILGQASEEKDYSSLHQSFKESRGRWQDNKAGQGQGQGEPQGQGQGQGKDHDKTGGQGKEPGQPGSPGGDATGNGKDGTPGDKDQGDKGDGSAVSDGGAGDGAVSDGSAVSDGGAGDGAVSDDHGGDGGDREDRTGRRQSPATARRPRPCA